MSYAIDSARNWLACGTSSGYIVGFDLRFMLKISEIKHQKGEKLIRIKKEVT